MDRAGGSRKLNRRRRGRTQGEGALTRSWELRGERRGSTEGGRGSPLGRQMRRLGEGLGAQQEGGRRGRCPGDAGGAGTGVWRCSGTRAWSALPPRGSPLPAGARCPDPAGGRGRGGGCARRRRRQRESGLGCSRRPAWRCGGSAATPRPSPPPPRALPAPRSGRWDAERRDSQTPAGRRKDARSAALGRARPPRIRQ